MTTISTAPAVMSALMNDQGTGILQVWEGLAQTQVTHGYPGRFQDREALWCVDVEYDTERWANVNRTQRDEEYHIALWIELSRPGYTAQEAIERVYVLAGEIEKALRDRPAQNPVGVTGVYQVEFIPDRTWTGVLDDNGSGRWASMRASIRVRARK